MRIAGRLIDKHQPGALLPYAKAIRFAALINSTIASTGALVTFNSTTLTAIKNNVQTKIISALFIYELANTKSLTIVIPAQ